MLRLWLRFRCWLNGHDGEELTEVENPKWGVLLLSYRCPCGKEWEELFYSDDEKLCAWIAGCPR